MLRNWLAHITRYINKARRRGDRVYAKSRPRLPELEVLEARVMLVVGGVPVAPGGPFDSVVKIVNANGQGSGSLLYDHNHILTAAHVVVGDTVAEVAAGAPAGTVTFNLRRQNDPGVGMGNTVDVPIDLKIPAGNQFQTVLQGYQPSDGVAPGLTNDLAILTLPDQTPAAGQTPGRLVAPFVLYFPRLSLIPTVRVVE